MPDQTQHNLIKATAAWRGWVAVSVMGWMICCILAVSLVADDDVPRGATVRQSNLKQPPSDRFKSVERRLPLHSPVASATRSNKEQRAPIRTAEQVQPVPARGHSVPNVKPVHNVSTADVVPAESEQSWWLKPMMEPMRNDAETLSISLESVLVRTLQHSYQIKFFSDVPLIRETGIVEAEAAFDWYGFLESRWDDTNDPVGSVLTGVPQGGRYKNNQFSSSTGARKRTLAGGQLEAAQSFGFQQSNSVYLVPSPQGTARLSLGYTHPLMRGRGQVYTTSLVCLAQIDKAISEQEFSRQIQSHLMDVARAFWQLHIARATVIQKRRSLKLITNLANQLRERSEIDMAVTQLERADAEIATREAEFTRAITAMRNAEGRLRALVNDPELGSYQDVELIPLDVPLRDSIPIDMQMALTRALQFRPELQQALEQIKAAAIRLDISQNQILPLLNLTTEVYVAGLQGGASVGDAWVDQFSVGGPGYAISSTFEYPLGNRAARTRADRRTLELRQMQAQYETTLKVLKLDVGTAIRELRTSYAEMLAQGKVAEATVAQLSDIVERWNYLSGEDGNGTLILENMLRTQNRVTNAEAAYLKAWVTYNLALINIKKSTGELLQHERMSWKDYYNECEGIKTRTLEKPDLGLQGWRP
ncbi:MAG: outer rane channel protein [Planctomycetaceae bacterium]|nr:outer rane channel protein [Planctomycetaceae bacterium]